MGERLAGKVAIVTGAGRGIGRGEALALAAEGASVVVNDAGVAPDGRGSEAAPADEVVAEIAAAGGKAAASYENIASFYGGQRLVRQTLATFGRLDIVVCNAGINLSRDAFAITEEEWDRMLAVHLKGHFAVIQPAAEIFRRQRSGRIITTSSLAGLGQLNHADYCAAKEGIAGLTRALALELGPYGVTVNAVRPRAATRMAAGVGVSGVAAAERPAERIGPFVAYLCTDAAAYINGRDFFVMGEEISLLSLPHPERTIVRPGGWDLEALEHTFPRTLGAGLTNPAPPR
jgi:NAD(P)-dependent dehydrogenase (short-subunit alcohol dehydrogenase family)